VYGTLLGAILFYQRLSTQLNDWGYVQNDYDPCRFNKVINGEQVTIQFHVDDLEISHKDQDVLDSILNDLNIKFGTRKKALTASAGMIHDYLGITINYNERNKMKFTMFDYLEDILSEMPTDMKGVAGTPAQDDLFTIDESSPLLNEKYADFYHRTTA
jgi:predicted nucleotidyltransferase